MQRAKALLTAFRWPVTVKTGNSVLFFIAARKFPLTSSMRKDRKHILIIDDDLLTCELVRVVLEKDYEVRIEHDSFDGLRAAQMSAPDLIICDLKMPGLSGHEVVEQLRSASATACVRVLLVTGENPAEVNATNVVGILRKPFHIHEMQHVISAALAARSAGAN
jgi:DNA-binding response OmpR family regulator